jgi:hypothetical protein
MDCGEHEFNRLFEQNLGSVLKPRNHNASGFDRRLTSSRLKKFDATKQFEKFEKFPVYKCLSSTFSK